MKRNFRLSALLAAALLFVGLSYSFRLECDIAVSGDNSVAMEALEKEIVKNGGKFVRAQNGEGGWYSIDGANLSFSRNAGNDILVSCSVFTGSGCVRSTAEKRTRETLEKLVAQASQASGIDMRILKTGEAKKIH